MCGCSNKGDSNKVHEKLKVYEQEIVNSDCSITMKELTDLKEYLENTPLNTSFLSYQYTIINSQIKVFEKEPCKYYKQIVNFKF